MGDPVPALNILITVLTDQGFALIAGTLLADCWLKYEPAGETIRLRWLSASCLAVLLLCHLARPWFLAASMGGTTHFRETMDLIPTVLSSTRQGTVWYAGAAALAFLLAAQFLPTAGRLWIGATALCLLAGTKAASGHASEAGDFSSPEIAQFLHIAAESIWAGAIFISGLFVIPRLNRLAGAKALWSYGKRLSRIVTYALIALVASGLYVSWSDMHGSVVRIATMTWGRTLLVKIVLVGLAAVLGSLVRFRCVSQPANEGRAATMVNLMRAEAVTMAIILCVSGVLANSNPAA